MKLHSYLKKNRLGIFYYRVQWRDESGKRRETCASLHTRDPDEARALSYHLSARIKPFLKRRGMAMEIDPKSINPNNIRELTIEGLRIESGDKKVALDRFQTSDDPHIAKHEIAALESILAGMQPKSEIVAMIEREKQEIDKAIQDQSLTLQQAIDKFMEVEKGGLAASSQKAYKLRMNMLAKHVGPNRGLGFIRKPDVVKAQEAITMTAPHDSKRNTSIKGRLSHQTIKDTLVLWKSFFDWCIRTERYIHDNPAAGLKPSSEAATSTGGAEAFDEDELKKIFAPENFAKCKRPHHYFVPFLALYTGARANELAQLRLSDIVEKSGLKCLRITHDEDGDVQTRTKNEASVRTIPIHPTLIKLGLLDYVEDLKSIEAPRLFPYLPLGEGTEKREKNVSRDMNSLLKRLGIWVFRRKTLHSFRDTLIRRLIAANGVDKTYRADYVGHSRKGTEETSYAAQKYTPAELAAKVLPEIDFGLSFEGIAYKKGCWNQWLVKNFCD